MTKQNDGLIARGIVDAVGGKDNIRAVGHCSTRLRLTLNDKNKVDEHAIEDIDGVKGQFFAGEQYQVILGTGLVTRVYELVLAGQGEAANADIKGDLYAGMSLPKKLSRILGDIFIPVIPVLVATGLFSGIINCINSFGVPMDKNVLTIATVLMKTAFTYLPVLIAWSGMRQFGGTPVLGIALGLMLVNPLLPNPNDVIKGTVDALTFTLPLGISWSVVSYSGSVLPALVVAWIAAKTERALKKVVPDILDLIVTPFGTLLVAGLLGLLVVGPACQAAERLILAAAKFVIALPFGLGGLILGGTQQAIVVTGMHHIFLALETDYLATTGFNPFNAMITGGIIAQATAALVTGFKVRDAKKRGFFMSASLPAFMGITEPAIFGVNLRFGRPFIFALTGGAAAGWVGSMLHAASTGMGVAAIPGFVTYLYSPDAVRNYFIIHGVAILVSGLLVWFFYDPNTSEVVTGGAKLASVSAGGDASTDDAGGVSSAVIDSLSSAVANATNEETLGAPLAGTLVPVAEVADQTFASEVLGPTVAVEPEGDGVVTAPCDGVVGLVYETGHAVGLTSACGAELVIHAGIDTVKLEGRGFAVHVRAGERVRAGEPLLTMDTDIVRGAGYSATTMLIVSNPDDIACKRIAAPGPIASGEPILHLTRK